MNSKNSMNIPESEMYTFKDTPQKLEQIKEITHVSEIFSSYLFKKLNLSKDVNVSLSKGVEIWTLRAELFVYTINPKRRLFINELSQKVDTLSLKPLRWLTLFQRFKSEHSDINTEYFEEALTKYLKALSYRDTQLTVKEW